VGDPHAPDGSNPQMHFDVMVEDVAASGPRVLALGARKLRGEGVYAGRPVICSTWSRGRPGLGEYRLAGSGG